MYKSTIKGGLISEGTYLHFGTILKAMFEITGFLLFHLTKGQKISEANCLKFLQKMNKNPFLVS